MEALQEGNEEGTEGPSQTNDEEVEEASRCASTKCPTRTRPSTKKQMKEAEDKPLKQNVNYLEQLVEEKGQRKRSRDENEYEIFGRHVAAELRAISSIQNFRMAKLRIQQILFEAETPQVQPRTFDSRSTLQHSCEGFNYRSSTTPSPTASHVSDSSGASATTYYTL